MDNLQVSDIETALQCISSTASQDDKNKALQFLEQFQRSTVAWSICNEILSKEDSTNALLELNIFAAQTLRNKVTYDLSQLENNLPQFKDSLLTLLLSHNQKLIITQLNVALARLAIQFLEWQNPIFEIISLLNSSPSILLNFLRILPEETLDIASTPLTEVEFNSRIHELIDPIAEDVLKFLVSCIDLLQNTDGNSSSSISLEQILRCLNSWSYEFPVEQLLTVQPLINLVFETISNGNESDMEAFDSAIDCLCVILRESRDTTNEQLISALFHQLMLLQEKLLPTLFTDHPLNDEYDDDLLEGMTRLFVEAGEAWSVVISKNPDFFKPMVLVLLMLTCKNEDLDVVSYTFPFWFNFKQSLVLPRYQESRKAYSDIFVKLINGIITHLQYPSGQFSSKEEEDKFKDFRYHMGDVLKDCTAVVGTSEALSQPLIRIKSAIENNNSWQIMEAPLFSLRTMAKEISLTENTILPEIIKIICNLPEQAKIRYASTLVLGRYTEWTAKHPELLEVQLQYIFNGFQLHEGSSDMQSIITASSHALMFFCSDCSKLLVGYIDQLINFFLNVQSSIDIESQFELCQGLSAVINNQPEAKVSVIFQKLVDDNLRQIEALIPQWKANPTLLAPQIADKIDLLYALFEELKPRYNYPQQGSEPLLPRIEFIWKALRTLLVDAGAMTDSIIVERVAKLLRRIFERFHVFCEPILPSVAEFLIQGYLTTGFGSYLWCSGSLIVMFGDDESFPISPSLKDAVWKFALSQCETFILNFNKFDKLQLNDYHEAIIDFFSLISDLIMFYPGAFLNSTELLGPVLNVALECVNKLDNYDAYICILRCLDDIISWGFKTPPISTVSIEIVPDEWRKQVINEVVIAHGNQLILVLFIGLVTTFENTAHSDAISCIVKCLRILTEANNSDATICIDWIYKVVEQLGQVTLNERDNLAKAVVEGLNSKDYRKVREGIRAFVGWYSRKNINSRFE
ncbi:ALI_HP2_G0049760.mRNA.1.CDS.1 [Saccharomyces cerevisiae]|nr:ALI_HP2_G0049760.mRNA.1.CDS.1 [Saccharomyces cerevisiae]CAI6773569.1 ALI_HP2_G0049760.mRNA.1.CDS.1 [Saccharomyces cerevisiae]CAI6786098.1 ALI_HP1_G0050490.mRNA.1.CDS.1 [Saccharomyces cerevisiae]